MDKKTDLVWRSHVPNLFSEVLSNHGTAILKQPLQITLRILEEVAQRAIELDDPKLHSLMMRLTLYSVADPGSPDYDREVVERFEKQAAA